MTSAGRLFTILMLLAVTPGRAGAGNEQLIIDSGGVRHPFRVELAVTRDEQARGLMFRTTLPADAGMLFFYGREEVRSMWMRNTFIPLDMIFIRADGRIAHIATHTVPFSERIIASPMPVKAVLDLNAGTVERLAIAPGDRVLHRGFANME